jgi:hypothetical protein
MRKTLLVLAFLALALPSFAADKFVGSWKLNTHKSTGPEVTDAALVAVDDGDMQTITVTGPQPDGTQAITKFSIPMKAGEGKIINATPFNGVTVKTYSANTEDFMFTVDGKPAMHIHSVLSSDGKTMTTTRRVISGSMKPGSMKPGKYVDVWER